MLGVLAQGEGDTPSKLNFPLSSHVENAWSFTFMSFCYIVTCFRAVTIDEFWIGWLDLLHVYTQLVTTSNYSATADLHFTAHRYTHTLEFLHFTSRILVTDFNTVIVPVSL
jgi:hypothetical protein